MASFGISENASEIEKIKQEFNDNLYGFNMVGEIDYETYSKVYDMAMPLFEKAFEEGGKAEKDSGFAEWKCVTRGYITCPRCGCNRFLGESKERIRKILSEHYHGNKSNMIPNFCEYCGTNLKKKK